MERDRATQSELAFLRSALFALVTGLLREHREMKDVEYDLGEDKLVEYLKCEVCCYHTYPCPTVALVRKVCPPEILEAAEVAVALGGGGE